MRVTTTGREDSAIMNRIVAAVVLVVLLSAAGAVAAEPCWVLFTDRGGIDVPARVEKLIASGRHPKTFSRRARVLGSGRVFDEKDLPVNEEYIRRVAAITGGVRTVTRFFNGVSVDLDDGQRDRIARLSFVASIRPVDTMTRKLPERASPPLHPLKPSDISYGNSYDQLAMAGVPGLHSLGYFGGGVTIAVLDSGYDNRGHAAFDSLNVTHTRDFVDGDDIPEGDDHGTEVLSVMGALGHGSLVGAAPYAEYILARTEIVEDGIESRLEEDYWIAAVEWADSLGADIIQSSLGYTEFDDGSGYTYEDMDGDTADITNWADIMVERGIVVVTSAGNEGNSSWYYISAPADGDSVIAVGAVDRNETIAGFSSRGPTFDGRVKPDFCALGKAVYVTGSGDGYIYKDGTSYAAPMVSGAAALLLEANPDWTPMMVYEAFRTTARDRGIAGPDSLYGHGIIDALAASGKEPVQEPVASFRMFDPFPQPVKFDQYNQWVYFPVEVPDTAAELSIRIFTFNGEDVRTLGGALAATGELLTPGRAPAWDGRNYLGERVAPGVYYYAISVDNSEYRTGKIVVMR